MGNLGYTVLKMKGMINMKRTIITIGVIVILAVISTSAVLAYAKPSTQNANMTSKSSEPTYESGSASTVSEAPDSSIVDTSQVFVSDSLSTLTANENFTKHGFSVKTITEAVKVNRSSAFDIANKAVGSYCKDSKSITGVLAKFTDSETPQLPETNIILNDYPVWIVTYNNVSVTVGNSHSGYKTIQADSNVVIDANSGEVLFQFEYKTN